MTELEKLRKRIDRLDRQLMALLNNRAGIAVEIGRLKQKKNIEFYSPEREKQVIENIKKLNEGPFPGTALETIFTEIISASRSLEEPLRVAYFGPAATFTHMAAIKHFGSSCRFVPADSIRGVFEVVDSGGASFGVVPIENSIEGVVSFTLDSFMDYDLRISAEAMLEITQNLLSLSGDISRIKRVYSFPHATAQCRQWLAENLPNVPVLATTSTAKAAETAAGDPEAAAVASEAAAKMYGLKFVATHIEDRRHNYTRFFIIGRHTPPVTGRDKTSIMFSVKDRPGALYDILAPFKKAKINLTKIESRPSKRRAWEYIFFVDFEGHIDEKHIKKAVEEIGSESLFLKVLGSYPMVEDDKGA